MKYFNKNELSSTAKSKKIYETGVKLAEELSKKDTGKTLYVLDEPTTGLHFQDVKLLLDVLQKLGLTGNERPHNLYVKMWVDLYYLIYPSEAIN